MRRILVGITATLMALGAMLGLTTHPASADGLPLSLGGSANAPIKLGHIYLVRIADKKDKSLAVLELSFATADGVKRVQVLVAEDPATG